MDINHYITHAYLSDARTGAALEAFPRDANIISVSRVKREEHDRRWSWSGYMTDNGCTVTGLKFTFEETHNNDNNLEVILHGWSQCKPIPFCGDQHTPEYSHFKVSKPNESLYDLCHQMMQGTSENIPYGKEVGFLPVDFLYTVGQGGLYPFDASGMMALNIDTYYQEIYESVKQGLGIGSGKDGKLFLLREKWTSIEHCRLVSIEVARKRQSGGSNISMIRSERGSRALRYEVGGQKKAEWIKRFYDEIRAGILDGDAIILHGSYDSVDEFLAMPGHLVASRELNACVPGRSKSTPVVLCTEDYCKSHLSSVLRPISLSSGEKMSVRFTAGLRSLISPFSTSLQNDNSFVGRYKSSVQVGCKGASLGYYHLVTSSDEGRNVLTLHGSLGNLLADLTGSTWAKKTEIDYNRKLIKEGKVQDILAQRNQGPGDVMSLRITNPSAEAVLACAKVLNGIVYYDSKTHSLYPIKYGPGGNVALPVACAVIIEVLETMRPVPSKNFSANIRANIRNNGVKFAFLAN